MFKVEFNIQSAAQAGCIYAEFENLRHMRDFMLTHFFSKKYTVRGTEKVIATQNGYEIGRLV